MGALLGATVIGALVGDADGWAVVRGDSPQTVGFVTSDTTSSRFESTSPLHTLLLPPAAKGGGELSASILNAFSTKRETQCMLWKV